MADGRNQTWLVAAWPGMGSVALGAGSFLVENLPAETVFELDATEHFDVEKIEVRAGLSKGARFPRSTFYRWQNPEGSPDLLIFVGEAQPAARGYSFAKKLLDAAQDLGADRLVTFAALATPVHPKAKARVFAVASDPATLEEISEVEGVTVLREGEISGLNGVLLAAAQERGMPGVCLLGELPFFAITVPNPKASAAVLRVFERVLGIPLDLSEIDGHAAAVERGLVELFDRMNRAIRMQTRGGEPKEREESSEDGFTLPTFARDGDGEGGEDGGDEDDPEKDGATTPDGSGSPSRLRARDRRRIEQLFGEARTDRTKALVLKHLLDELGAFKEFEDRFLDLFTRGE